MLKGKKVKLVPLTSDDIPVLFEWINDREQVLFNAPYKPVNEISHREWFESVRHRDDVVIFGIRLIETDRLIGSCQLLNISAVHRVAELQIRIGQVDARGHGYGTEAVGLLLDFAFKDRNLHRLFLHVFATNAAAIRAYEKAGFVREGLLREAAHIDGARQDVVVMGVLRQEHLRRGRG